MASLEFDNLPLIEATCNVVFKEPRFSTWDELNNVREAVKDILPNVGEFMVGTQSPIGFVIGAAPGASFDNRAGLTLTVRGDRYSCTWRKLSPESKYVRFASLSQAVKAAVAVGRPGEVGIVNMVYVNRAPDEHGSPRDLIVPSAWPLLASGELRDYNVAWILESGIEFRLQVTRAEGLALISTAAGLHTEDNWEQALAQVHDALQEEFIRITTDKAHEVWQWKKH